jgi:Immunity protein family (Imm11)
MPYYFIQCVSWFEEIRELEGGTPTPELEPGVFTDGERITKEISQPLVWNLMPGQGEMPPFFDVPAFVVRKDFARALREGGADNIDYYDVTIRDPQTGQTWNDYLLANVIGVVDAIDMQKSEIDPDSPPDTAVLFDKIVIDDSRTRGLQIFRPLHKQSDLLVSKELRDHIESKNFKYVEFVEPEEYA